MITFGFIVLIICSALCIYRIGRGPTVSDRSVAIDILGIIVVAFCVLLYFKTKDGFYLIVAITWAVLSFIGVLALAKFLEDKGFDE